MLRIQVIYRYTMTNSNKYQLSIRQHAINTTGSTSSWYNLIKYCLGILPIYKIDKARSLRHKWDTCINKHPVIVDITGCFNSGSMFTANIGLDENRSVCAIPGRIDAPLSVGCNSLIAAGAKPILSAQDLLDEFRLYNSRAWFLVRSWLKYFVQLEIIFDRW